MKNKAIDLEGGAAERFLEEKEKNDTERFHSISFLKQYNEYEKIISKTKLYDRA